MNNQTGAVCPKNTVWLDRMLEILPPGLRGKLEAYANCPIDRNGIVKIGRRAKSDERRVIRPVLR